MDIHVLTPFSRPQNLRYLLPAYVAEKVVWHLIAYPGQAPSISPLPAWMTIHNCPAPPKEWDVCYWKLNWFIRRCAIENSARYVVMPDDDGWDPGYFDALRSQTAPVVITRMNAGDFRPPRSAHPSGKFRADPTTMRPGSVGFQFAVTGEVLKRYAFCNRPDADGQAAEYFTTFYDATYLAVAKRFNWLEPGRWKDSPCNVGSAS